MTGSDSDMMKPGIAVGVLVIREHKLLLGKRHPASIGGGSWCVPMGKLEFGEALRECGQRELAEESGLKAREMRALSFHNVIMPTSHFLTISLLACDVTGEPEVTAPEEMTAWEWFSLDSLPEPLFYPVRAMVDVYLEEEGYHLDRKVLEMSKL